jgi:AraC-like DNA-binding protein
MGDRRRAPDAAPMRMHSIPSAGGAISRLVCAQLREANIPLSPLLAKAGLTVEQIDDDSARLKASSQVRFLALAAAALHDDLLGIHVSLDFELRRTGLYYYVLASSENIGEALQRAERYGRIVNEGIALTCNTTRDVAIKLAYVGVDRRLDRHQIEFWLVSLVRLFRQLAERRLVPSRVRLAHHRARTPPELRSLLGCEIEFDAEVDEIVFPAPVRLMPIGSADHYLNELLIKYCEEALAHRGAGHSALRTNVEKAIATLLPHGKAQAAEVARRLGMSPRTLTRRLGSEGLTFSGILEEQRIDLARHYLRESDIPISQIGWLLGYREISAFTHAFKRWTGATPKQSRTPQPSAQQKKTSRHRGRSEAKGERQ